MTIKILSNGSTKEDIAWAAGLFEGEGCISFSGHTPEVSIGMTDEDVLIKFRNIIGIGHITKPRIYKGTQSHWKPKYTWKTSSFERVQYVIALLFGYLGNRRKSRATEVLEIAKARPAWHGNKTHCIHGHEFTKINTIERTRINKDSSTVIHRDCRQCQKDRNDRRKEQV